MPTTTPFANLITFSRGSNATVVGPNGLVQWAPSNIHTFSEQFDNAAWSKTNAVIYPNQNSAGGTLGSELVTNGDFSNGSTGWITASWVVSGGVATITNVIDSIAQNVSLTAGRLYRVTYTVTAFSGTGGVRPRFFGGTTVTGTTVSAPGTYTEYLYAVTGNTQVAIASTSNTCTVSIDDISVREVTPAAAIAPDGTQTADTLLATAGTGFTPRVADTSLTTVNGAVHTASIYVRPVSYTFLQIYINNQAADWANFTLAGAGTATANGSCTAAIQALSDGWYRVSITYTAGGTDRRPFYMLAASATATRAQAWNPNGSEAVLLWGAQLELGSAATTYNPTTVKNLLGFSEAFDNANWTKTNTSIVTGAAANPINGLFTAQKLMEGTVNAQYAVFRSVAVTAAPYTFSLYAKLAPGAARFLSLYPQTSGAAWAIFDLSLGTITAVSALNYVSSSITSVGNGWYRCSVTLNASAGTLNCVAYLANTNNNSAPTYTGDGNSGIYIYGAQLSDSASLDPYVPTPGAAPSSTAYYGPRFDYDPATLQPRGILIEEQRTNLLLRSEEFDSVTWGKTLCTVVANDALSPDGTVDADKVTDNSTSGTELSQAATVTSGATVAHSRFFKYIDCQWVRLAIGDATNFVRGWFDIQNGVAGATTVGGVGTGAAISITNAGNGWYRCTLVGALTGLTSYNCLSMTADANSSTIRVSGGSYHVYGAQLEAGAFATSYIPTIASTVTRSADVATITGQNFGQWYTQSEGTFVYQYQRLPGLSVALGGRIFASGVGGSNSYGIWVNTVNSAQDALTIRDISGDAVASALFTVNTSAVNKGGVAYKANDFAWSSNGGAATTDTSGAVPSLSDQLRLGRAINTDASYLNGHIRSIRFIPVRAADFQLQALTT